MAPGWDIPKAWGPQFILTNNRVPTAGGKPSSEHLECSKVTKRKRREQALTLEASLHFLCQGTPRGREDKAEPSAEPGHGPTEAQRGWEGRPLPPLGWLLWEKPGG